MNHSVIAPLSLYHLTEELTAICVHPPPICVHLRLQFCGCTGCNSRKKTPKSLKKQVGTDSFEPFTASNAKPLTDLSPGPSVTT